MEWWMTTWDGARRLLPEPTAWRLDYGLGEPCDRFWVRAPWEAGQEQLLADGTRMEVRDDGGAVVFRGVLDETACAWSAGGRTVELSGRGMQALLLDNEAEAADHGRATWETILRGYVRPYGIDAAAGAALPPVDGFSVPSGRSCWGVVVDFCRYHGGVVPWFDRGGTLRLGLPDGAAIALDEDAPVTELVLRQKRYGVLSQVVVKDVAGRTRQVVRDEDRVRRGFCAGRVLLLPRKTGHQARRYRAQYQLDRSGEALRTVEVTLPLGFAAWPGDPVQLTRAGAGFNGRYRVAESCVRLDGTGLTTRLTLQTG